MSEPEKQQLTIVAPPDFVFKYRKRSRVEPSREVLKSDGAFKFIGVKYPSLYTASSQFLDEKHLQRDWFKYPVSFGQNEQGESLIFVHQQFPWPMTDEEVRMGGQLACFEQVPHPFKGHPFPAGIFAINQAKRFLRSVMENLAWQGFLPFYALFIILPKRWQNGILSRLLTVYVDQARKAMDSYILRPEFMTKYGREILKFTESFLREWGLTRQILLVGDPEGRFAPICEAFAEVFATAIDGDNAYWMRIGDAFRETTWRDMLEHPRRELKKLAELMVRRNPSDPRTAKRVRLAVMAVWWLLLWPRFRRTFRQAWAEVDIWNLQFDTADEYHSWLFGDYDYGGHSLEERLKLYKEYHRQHPPEPERVVLQP